MDRGSCILTILSERFWQFKIISEKNSPVIRPNVKRNFERFQKSPSKIIQKTNQSVLPNGLGPWIPAREHFKPISVYLWIALRSHDDVKGSEGSANRTWQGYSSKRPKFLTESGKYQSVNFFKKWSWLTIFIKSFVQDFTRIEKVLLCQV